MSPRPRQLVRFVYVIGPKHGLQKVGIAMDPQTRLSALQTGNPASLTIHAALPVPFRDAHAIERAAHARLAACRVRNEWFDTTPAEAIVVVHEASAPFLAGSTLLPDPSVVWPAVASWRLEPGRGLPLFDHAERRAAAPDGKATPSNWWERLRRTLETRR